MARGAPGPVQDQAAYPQLLRDLGCLVEEPADFWIETSNVDGEMAVQAGPQLMVPILNGRFAANAVNAVGLAVRRAPRSRCHPGDRRAGQGADLQPAGRPRGHRGSEAIPRCALRARPFGPPRCRGLLGRGRRTGGAAEGWGGSSWSTLTSSLDAEVTRRRPRGCCSCTHGLHMEIQDDRDHQSGKDDSAGVKV